MKNYKMFLEKINVSIETLFSLIEQNHYNLIKEYLDKGGDINITTYDNKTMLYKAITSGKNQIIKLLLNHNPDLNIKTRIYEENILHVLIEYYNKYENTNYIKIVLERKKELINEQNINGYTPLHYAAIYSFDSTELLLLLKYKPDWTLTTKDNKDFLFFLDDNVKELIMKEYPEEYKRYKRYKELNKFNI